MDLNSITEALEHELQRADAPAAERQLFAKLAGQFPGLDRSDFNALLASSPRFFLCPLDKLNLLVGLAAWGERGYLQAVQAAWRGTRVLKDGALPKLSDPFWRAIQRVAREKGDSHLAALAGRQLPVAEFEPTTLLEWQRWLEGRVSRVQLLGELNITATAQDSLTALLRNFVVRSETPADAIHQLEAQYALPFAVFLVFHGIRNYFGNTYWPPIGEALSLPAGNMSNSSSQMGQAFERILERHALPSMDKLSGARYVRRIVAHGGIPDYSLAPFFSLVVRPSVTEPDLQHLTAGELVGTLQQWDLGAGQAVRWFVEAGGRYAEDIIERCRDLTRESLRVGEVVADDTGLPERFLDGLRSLFETDSVTAPSIQAPVIPRPFLALDPWAEGVRVDFPATSLAAKGDEGQVTWQVSWGRQILQQSQSLRANRGKWELPAQSFRLPEPAREYRCSLQIDGQSVLVVNLAGVDRDKPLLLFSPLTGRALGQRIPDRQTWLLFPKGQLLVDGVPARFLEQFPEQYGGWASYECCWLDLSGSRTLEIAEPRYRLELAPEVNLALAGSVAIDDYRAESGIPVYCGQLPVLTILLGDLTGWKLQVQSDLGPRSLAGPALEAYREGDSLRIPLEALVGGRQPGEYRILLRGQLGQDSRRVFRFVSALEISPSASREHRGQLLVRLPAEARLLQQGTYQAPLRAQEQDQIFLVRPTSGRSHLAASVEYPRLGLAPYTLPLSLIHPKPCWALSGLSQDVALHWSDGRLECPLAMLEDAPCPELLLQLPDDRQVELLLLNEQGGVKQASPLQMVSQKASRGRARFALKPFVDTLRASNRAGTDLLWRFSCESLASLYVTRHWQARDLGVQVEEGGVLVLRWRQDFPAHHRHVRIWDLSWPAAAPTKFSIPEDAQEEFTFSPGLAAGAYQLELFIEDPWLAGSLSATSRPPRTSPNNVIVHLSPDQWGSFVEQLPATGRSCLQSFLLHYERTQQGRHTHLYELRNRLGAAELDSFFRAVLHLAVDDRANHEDVRVALEQYFTAALTDHVDNVLRVIPAVVGDESPEYRDRFIELLLGLGLTMDSVERTFRDLRQGPLGALELDQVWRFWEPLGLIVELQAPAPGVCERLNRYLGPGWRDLIGRTNLPDWGQPPGPVAHWPLEQLKSTWHFLGITPEAPLDPVYLQRARYLTWRGLFEREQREEARRWVEQAWAGLEQEARRYPPETCAALLGRLPGMGERTLDALSTLPFIVGCVAYIQRARAHGQGFQHYPKAQLMENTKSCFRFAPELFARDLCQVELALVDRDFEEDIQE